ncbi:hypothetical protein D9756_001156 [Leucocoprinus leucothites]|uniref:DUF7928 domain-containing protein n=1 Tax=Leucocoprinus leucothites TaxID=201217 RepID=A0A8H5LHJ9_9AGAR|nr:hypothetical protein D9756_001156 [Leucoagaricus leucothites]
MPSWPTGLSSSLSAFIMSAVTIHNSDYDLFDAWLHKIYETTQQDNWFMPTEDIISTGVCLRVEDNYFRVFPYENPALVPFEAAVRRLNPVVAVKLRSAAVTAAIRKIGPTDDCIYIDRDTRIQVIETIDELPHAEKDQCGAFIRDERSLVLWSYSLETMIPLCKEFEEKLIKHIWRTRTVARKETPSISTSINPSIVNSEIHLNEKTPDSTQVSKEEPAVQSQPAPKRKWWSWRLNPNDKGAALKDSDPEKKSEERKLILLGPFYAGCGAALSAYFMASGAGILLEEYAMDHNAARFGLFATLPIIFCISIFFCLQLVGNLSLIFGPVAQYHENSMYYSAVKPKPNPEIDSNLPHITIQMPVYKESLELTIAHDQCILALLTRNGPFSSAPSVFSIKKAMQTYARQGGTSAIFVCDDGMQVLSEIDQLERKAFYANHNIGWTARPGHSSKPDGFKRAGKFKKASNMNYGLSISLKLEKFLAQLIQEGVEDTPTSVSRIAL